MAKKFEPIRLQDFKKEECHPSLVTLTKPRSSFKTISTEAISEITCGGKPPWPSLALILQSRTPRRCERRLLVRSGKKVGSKNRKTTSVWSASAAPALWPIVGDPKQRPVSTGRCSLADEVITSSHHKSRYRRWKRSAAAPPSA
jgi:hypothetical protein